MGSADAANRRISAVRERRRGAARAGPLQHHARQDLRDSLHVEDRLVQRVARFAARDLLASASGSPRCVPLVLGAAPLPNSARTRSLEAIIPSSRFLTGAISRRWWSASAKAEASLMILSISVCERPPAGLIWMPCALPVARSLRGDVDDAVRVDRERDLDLRHAARRGRDADQLEAAEGLVLASRSRARPAGRGSRRPTGCRRRS